MDTPGTSRTPEDATAADVERAFPNWSTWPGADGMFHALRTRGAALTARGESWTDLFDVLRRAESGLEDGRPASWRGPRLGK